MSIKSKLFEFEENCVKKIDRDRCDKLLFVLTAIAMFLPVVFYGFGLYFFTEITVMFTFNFLSFLAIYIIFELLIGIKEKVEKWI